MTGSMMTRAALAALLLNAALAGGCSGSSDDENEILPIVADIAITDTSSSDPQAVYLERVSAAGDLVTVNVMLRTTTTPVTFDAYSLEIELDTGLVSVAAVDFLSSPLASCSPLTVSAISDNSTLVIGVAASGSTCPGGYTTNTSTPEILVTLGLRAATTGSSELHFVSDPLSTGHCSILNILSDIGIPCVDGSPAPTLTATR